MTLFSWFIKRNSQASSKQTNIHGVIETSSIVELKDGVVDEFTTINNNTMWPIAKVKTTTMMIKKPQTKASGIQSIAKTANTSLVIIPLGH